MTAPVVARAPARRAASGVRLAAEASQRVAREPRAAQVALRAAVRVRVAQVVLRAAVQVRAAVGEPAAVQVRAVLAQRVQPREPADPLVRLATRVPVEAPVLPERVEREVPAVARERGQPVGLAAQRARQALQARRAQQEPLAQRELEARVAQEAQEARVVRQAPGVGPVWHPPRAIS